ncbi:MAG: Mov34/MPN/PAD-1 family protein [Thermoplasmatota archaeon]
MGIFDRFRKKPASDPMNFSDGMPRGGAAAAKAPKRRIHKVEREVLELVCASAKSSHPHEFGAVLRAEGDTVTEILLVPTIQGNRHAIMSLSQLPIDPSACGTVHSHPSPYPIPSDADKQLFRHFGNTHIIIANPYTMQTWRSYDQEGEPIRLQVV